MQSLLSMSPSKTLPMPPASTLSHPALHYIIFFFITPLLPTLTFADNFSVTSHPALLRLTPGRPVEDSPGARPSAIVTCNRVHLHGLSRLRNLDKFFHSLKLTASVSQGDGGLFRIQSVEICLHRNASLGIGMCSGGFWRKIANKGLFVRSLSPFEDWFVDVRVLPDPTRLVEISTELEFFLHRLVFLVLGFCMLIMAQFLSESITFYYGSAMTIGVILVILMVLYQGMKLLPTGRTSSLAIVMYSSIVGVVATLFHYISGILRPALVEIGIYEDMHKPLGVFLLVCLILAGAWFGYWGVRKLVLTDEGLVDAGVAYFVKWAIFIFSSIMILQSSLDTILAAQALIAAIIISAVSRTHGKLKFLHRLFRRIYKCIYYICSKLQFPNRSLYTLVQELSSASRTQPQNRRSARNNSTNPGLRSSPNMPYYSSFHRTPEKKKFNKEEWEAFTREETKKGLRELVSSPDFTAWAVENADRITLTPPPNATRIKRRRLFRWWS